MANTSEVLHVLNKGHILVYQGNLFHSSIIVLLEHIIKHKHLLGIPCGIFRFLAREEALIEEEDLLPGTCTRGRLGDPLTGGRKELIPLTQGAVEISR